MIELFLVLVTIALFQELVEMFWQRSFISHSCTTLYNIGSKKYAFTPSLYYSCYILLLFTLLSALISSPKLLPLAPALYLIIHCFSNGKYNGGSSTQLFFHLLIINSIYALPHLQLKLLSGYKIFFCLQYFIAGLSKLKSSHWRNGTALKYFFRTDMTQESLSQYLLKLPSVYLSISCYIVLLFELLFPLILLGGFISKTMILIGIFFHFSVFLIFGLNRFFWTWIAAFSLFL